MIPNRELQKKPIAHSTISMILAKPKAIIDKPNNLHVAIICFKTNE